MLSGNKLFCLLIVLIGSIVFHFPGKPMFVWAQGTPFANTQTAEEVGGASLRDVNGVRMMTRDFSVSPSGNNVPQSEEDRWIPNMSLGNPSYLAAARSTNTQSAVPIPAAVYHTGFQVGASALPAIPQAVVPQVVVPQVIVPQAAIPQAVIPQNLPNETGWKDQFSRPNDLQNPQAIDMILSSKEATEMNLSEMIIKDIRVSGLEMPIYRFNNLIKTKIGSKFNQQVLEEDKRALLQTKHFIDVTVSTTLMPDLPGHLIVNFDLTPRRVMQYIKISGNTKISRSDILDEIGMKQGDSRMDPYDVENGRLRIIELYRNKGFNEVNVEILRGDRPEDIGVVYLIDEGNKQKVLKTEFTGNQIASSARLRTLVTAKPGILYYIGGDFSRERLDEDVTKLLEYYRKLGFFDARIDREYEEGAGYTGFGKPNSWITVRYVINEGPRYRVRNFLFEGNNVINTPELEKLLKVKTNDFYDQNAIEMDRITIKFEYQDRGYVLAEIEPKQTFTEEEGYLDLRYVIEEKSRYRVRDILIEYEGAEARTKSTVILNMLDFRPGEVIPGRKIRMSENTLKRSGYFNDKPSEGTLPTIKVIPDSDKPLEIQDKNTKLDIESKKMTPHWPVHSKETPSPAITRGQMRQVPTGFSSTTTTPSTGTVVSTPNGYVATPNNNSVAPPLSNYSDTSMYNNSALTAPRSPGTGVVSGGNGTAANSPAPYNLSSNGQYTDPAAQMGLYSNLPPQNAPQVASATPGFNPAGMAGVDAVFPGTLEQQSLQNALGGNGTIGQPNLQQINTINNADVVAKIREGRTGMFTASVGVNSDYGLVGNIGLTERNFDLFRWPTSWSRADGWKDAFRGGGQIFQVQASPGTNIQRYSVSWDVPYILNTKNTFGVTGLFAQRNYYTWFETRAGGEVRLGRQWTPRFSTQLNGSAYSVKVSDPIVDYIPDLTDAMGTHAIYSVGLSASYDTRNHPFLPSQGYVVTGGADMVLGDYQFPRAYYDARHYSTLHKRWDGSGRWVLGLRSAAGWVGKDAPIFERYFGGGSMNLRGFEYREVTPRYPESTIGIGGHFEFYNSAEFMIPLSGGDELQMAFFIDTGTVAESINKWDKYRVAPGLGLRVAIPMLGPAPLALDLAFPVIQAERDVKQVFSFSVSGSR